MESSRLPRFQRASSVASIQLTQRDCQIVRLVYRHRFLRSSHIVSLLDGSPQQLLRRLQLLYHHGYLNRPRVQLEYYHRGGSRPIVYGLGKQGVALVKRELGVAFRDRPWDQNDRGAGRMFLQHELLVADVMVTIDLACRQNGIRLLTEHELAPHSERFRWKVKIQGGSKLSVVPDRVFALESQNDNSESNRAFFFLEADRGTMPVIRKTLSQTSFYRKLLAYEATWSQSIHLARFGFHRFRVLTVTTSAERVKSLVDACSKLKGGHGLFLFADQTILSGNILSSTWQTGKPGETGRLLH